MPPETQPLHEVCYYSSSALLRRHLNATPRTSIQTALSSPYHYLQVPPPPPPPPPLPPGTPLPPPQETQCSEAL